MYPIKRLHKPTRRDALSAPIAILATAIVIPLALLVRAPPSFEWGLVAMALLFGIPLLRITLARQEAPTPHGRRLEIEDSWVRQYEESGEIVAKIDAAQPFQYRVLDLAEQTDPRVRLYQNKVELTFFPTDPGGEDVIQKILKIRWPPRPRIAAGYSG